MDVLHLEKKQKQNEGATSTFFLVSDFFQIQKFTFSHLNTLRNPPKIKEHRLKSKSMWFGEEKVACFSYLKIDECLVWFGCVIFLEKLNSKKVFWWSWKLTASKDYFDDLLREDSSPNENPFGIAKLHRSLLGKQMRLEINVFLLFRPPPSRLPDWPSTPRTRNPARWS